MLDHAFGRPSASWRRIEVLAVALLALRKLKTGQGQNRVAEALDRRLALVRPWKIILGTLTAVYLLKNLFLLLFLNGPEPMSRMYTRSYFRMTWIATATDVGWWTAMPIKVPWLRAPLSLLFSVYYLLNPEQAANKARRYQVQSTSETMRAAWEKGTSPLLGALMRLTRSPVRLRRHLLLERPEPASRTLFPDGQTNAKRPPVRAWLFFDGTDEELREATRLVLQFPGGGFVTMSPLDHESYTSQWTRHLRVPVLSIDYGKAPEFPYPWGIEECFDAYRAVAESNGTVLGIAARDTPLQIVLAGDSAGGNFCASVILKIVETQIPRYPYASCPRPLPSPAGCLLVYPCLSFDMSCWLSPEYLQHMKEGSTRHVHRVMEDRETLSQSSPLAARPAPRRTTGIFTVDEEAPSPPASSEAPPRAESLWARLRRSVPFRDRRMEQFERERGPTIHSNLGFSSRMTYSCDRILTIESMRAMAILYLGGAPKPPNFAHDYYLSPIVAPDELLVRFPPTVIVCGEKDPLVDDTIFLAARLRNVKARARSEWGRLAAKLMPVAIAESGSGRADGAIPETFPPELRMHAFGCRPADTVHVKILDGMSHGFLNYADLLTEGKQVVRMTSMWLERLFDLDAPRVALDDRCGHNAMLSSKYQSFTETMVSSMLRRGVLQPQVGPHPYHAALYPNHAPFERRRFSVDESYDNVSLSPTLDGYDLFPTAAAAFEADALETSAPGCGYYCGASLAPIKTGAGDDTDDEVRTPTSEKSASPTLALLRALRMPDGVVPAEFAGTLSGRVVGAAAAAGRTALGAVQDHLRRRRSSGALSSDGSPGMRPSGVAVAHSAPEQTSLSLLSLTALVEGTHEPTTALGALPSALSMSSSLDQVVAQLDRRRNTLAQRVFDVSQSQ